MQVKSTKVVHVKWIDSESVHGWQSKERFSSFSSDSINACESIGILAFDGTDHIVIAQSVSDNCIDGNIKIPKCAIKSSKVIATVKMGQSLE